MTPTVVLSVVPAVLLAALLLTAAFGFYRLRQKRLALEQALQSAEEAALRKTEFLSLLSQEIRAPVNNLIGLSSTLLQSGLDKQQAEMAEAVKQSGEAVVVILDHMLDFSMIESGKLSIEAKEFELSSLVESVTRSLAQKAQGKGVELCSLLRESVPRRLIGDAARVRQISLSFLGHAVEFASRSSVLFEVSANSLEEGQWDVTFSVSDSGAGMNTEMLKRVFEPLEAGIHEASQTPQEPLLGLSISVRLVRLMAGCAGWENPAGGGVRIWATLPFSTTLQEPSSETTLPTTAPSSESGIIIDESGVVATTLQHYLNAIGIDLVTTASKLEVKEFARQEGSGDRKRWIFINDPSGEKAGINFCRELSSQGLRGDAKVVVLTPLSYRADRIDLQRAGVSATLRKPIRLESVQDLVESLRRTPRGQLVSEAPFADRGAAATPSPPFFENSRQLKILVADDNQLNANLLVRMLDKLGFEAVVAHNGKEVLELVEKDRFDILFMDCLMPEGNGLEVTQKIRDREKNPRGLDDIRDRCHIIAMMAESEQGHKEQGLEAGMDEFLVKPIPLPVLQNAIGRHLQSITALRKKHRPVETERRSRSQNLDTTHILKRTIADENLLDRERLKQIRSFAELGGPDPLSEFLVLFSEHTRGEFERLRQALLKRDLAKVIESVHAMKGNATNIGAMALHLRFVSIEELAELQDWEGLEGKVADAERDFARSVLALEHELRHG